MSDTAAAPPADVLASIRAILDYDWRTELRDFEEQGEPEGHVFDHLQRVNRWLEEPPIATVHVVEVFDRTDGAYVFADFGDAQAFEATVNGDSELNLSQGAACYRTEEVVCDHALALKLIASECEANAEAEAASLETDVPVSARAWRKGEDAPYPDKLEAVEYVVYPREDDDLEDENFQRGSRSVSQRVVLWVGLHPEMGCVNVDAGRERLEAEGWEVTDWGAA